MHTMGMSGMECTYLFAIVKIYKNCHQNAQIEICKIKLCDDR